MGADDKWVNLRFYWNVLLCFQCANKYVIPQKRLILSTPGLSGALKSNRSQGSQAEEKTKVKDQQLHFENKKSFIRLDMLRWEDSQPVRRSVIRVTIFCTSDVRGDMKALFVVTAASSLFHQTTANGGQSLSRKKIGQSPIACARVRRLQVA